MTMAQPDNRDSPSDFRERLIQLGVDNGYENVEQEVDRDPPPDNGQL